MNTRYSGKPTPQQEIILEHLRGGEWVCGSAWLGQMKDDRRRIFELNEGYMKQRGYQIIGKKCDGRCGKTHSSGLFMRKAVRLGAATMNSAPIPAPINYTQHSIEAVAAFKRGELV